MNEINNTSVIKEMINIIDRLAKCEILNINDVEFSIYK